jgi:hypothetical protein
VQQNRDTARDIGRKGVAWTPATSKAGRRRHRVPLKHTAGISQQKQDEMIWIPAGQPLWGLYTLQRPLLV